METEATNQIDITENNDKLILVGITGGIGSGKTTVSNYLKKKGYSVINADEVAKYIIENDNSVKKKIIETFGKESYIEDRYNTKFIAKIVFENEDSEVNLNKLNRIVHPKVLEHIINEIEELAIAGNKIVFIDIALLFELELEEGFDFIIAVVADENLRIARITNRSKLTQNEIKQRMKSQISQEDKIRYSDFTIENNKSIEELYKSVDFLLPIILAI